MHDAFITGSDRAELQARLAEGEQLLWCGKPAVSFLSQGPVTAFLAPFIFWAMCVAGLLQELAEEPCNAANAAAIGGFVLLATVVMILFPIFIRRSANAWLYGLTDRRAILIWRKELYEYPLKPYMALRAHAPQGKCGSIVFERRKKGRGSVEIGFLYTPEAAEALRLLHRLLDGKVTEADKPEELRLQEKREKCMAYAKLFIPIVVAEAVATTFIALLAARLLGLYPAFLSSLSSEETLGLLGFIFLMWVCITLLLRDCYLGRKYAREQHRSR